MLSIKPDEIPSDKGSVSVRKMYKEGKMLINEDMKDEFIDVGIMHPLVPKASVSASARITINLGNFESTQIGVDVTIPCYLEELHDAHEAALSFVNMRLNREVAELRDARAKKPE